MWPTGKVFTAVLSCISLTRSFASLNTTEAKQLQCCVDLFLEADIATWGKEDLAIMPPSCMVDDGVGCPIFGMYPSEDGRLVLDAEHAALAGSAGTHVGAPNEATVAAQTRDFQREHIVPFETWHDQAATVDEVTHSSVRVQAHAALVQLEATPVGTDAMTLGKRAHALEVAVYATLTEIPEESNGIDLVEDSAEYGTVDGRSPLGTRTAYESHPEWRWLGLRAYAFYHVVGLFRAATFPLRQVDAVVIEEHPMTYKRRLLAVASLWLLCGGGTMLFLLFMVLILNEIWWSWGVWWTCAPLVILCVGAMYLVMGPLPYRRPCEAAFLHAIFALWREYFNFTYSVENEELLEKLARNVDLKFLFALLPHGIMPFGGLLGMSVRKRIFSGIEPIAGVVATALLRTPVLRTFVNYLGARKAGTKPIEDMFNDNYRGVGVVTGGIAEMFVSKKSETLTSLRKNFAKIALRGGHVVVPMFVFGTSRTHDLWRVADNRVTKSLSRKLGLPILMFTGAFNFVPHRQKLTMVVCSPIVVDRVPEPTDAQANALCARIEADILQMYAARKPAGETREARFER